MSFNDPQDRSVGSIPAATVVIFRHAASGPPELLMVQRSRALRFAGGAVVFPGGKVDPEDRVLATRLFSEREPEDAAARIAAMRETLEETGLVIAVRQPVSSLQAAQARSLLLQTGALAPVLDAFGWTLDLDRLRFYAHWRQPVVRGFDTRFFVCDLGTGAVDIAVDATENSQLFWASAARVLDMAARGEITVIFPTMRNLERLAKYATFGDALEDIARHPVSCIRPRVTQRDGMDWIEIPDGLGYPVLREPAASVEHG